MPTPRSSGPSSLANKGSSQRKPNHELEDEELADLQRRFKALEDESKERATMLANVQTQHKTNTQAKQAAAAQNSRQHTEQTDSANNQEPPADEAELARLDDQIAHLRRKHDDLVHSNMERRAELDKLNDKIQDLSRETARPSASNPVVREIKVLEQRLKKAVARYEEALEVRRTYEQIVKRLKQERIGFEKKLEEREEALKLKETDYEELLLMSHDANQSKELAKQELSKLEASIAEERRQREKEVAERRAIVAQKQEINADLERRERQRREAMAMSAHLNKESQGPTVTQEDIEVEQEKIAAYEAAFREIKEATGVTDVNEVIQKFVSQEETYKSLLQMTRESQDKMKALEEAKAEARERVRVLKYSAKATCQVSAAPGNEESRKQERQRLRYERLSKVLVAVKAGIEHLVERLEGVQLDEEPVVMADDTLVGVLRQCEKKLRIVMKAVKEEEAALTKELGEAALRSVSAEVNTEPPVSNNFRIRDDTMNDDINADEEFEEELDEEVIDRDSLKKQSGSILDKATKRTKRLQRQSKV